MKKIFFLTLENFDKEKSSGICRKIKSEISSFEANGFQVSYTYIFNNHFMYNDSGKIVSMGEVKGISIRNSCWSILLRNLDKINCSITYIRYALADGAFLILLRKLSKKSQIIIEIPTYPYDNELDKKKIIDLFNITVDKIFRKKIYKYVQRIVSYTEDKYIWKIPVIKGVNGYKFSDTPIRRFVKNDIIDLIAVANLGKWHAYDRLINGIAEYYINGGKRNIIFHLVGDGKPMEEYRKIVKKYNMEQHIKLYGILQGKELEAVYDIADIGICSLGVHRIGIYVTSELKSREYAAKGLPMIASSIIDVFPSEWEYMMKVEADESSINILDIIDYYDRLYHVNQDCEKMFNIIRDFAYVRCDEKYFMKNVIEYMEEL